MDDMEVLKVRVGGHVEQATADEVAGDKEARSRIGRVLSIFAVAVAVSSVDPETGAALARELLKLLRGEVG